MLTFFGDIHESHFGSMQLLNGNHIFIRNSTKHYTPNTGAHTHTFLRLAIEFIQNSFCHTRSSWFQGSLKCTHVRKIEFLSDGTY